MSVGKDSHEVNHQDKFFDRSYLVLATQDYVDANSRESIMLEFTRVQIDFFSLVMARNPPRYGNITDLSSLDCNDAPISAKVPALSSIFLSITRDSPVHSYS